MLSLLHSGRDFAPGKFGIYVKILQHFLRGDAPPRLDRSESGDVFASLGSSGEAPIAASCGTSSLSEAVVSLSSVVSVTVQPLFQPGWGVQASAPTDMLEQPRGCG